MAFIINIKDLPEGISRHEFAVKASDFPLDYEGIEPTGMLSAKADITKSHDQIIFRGRVSAQSKLICSRCAEEFEKTIDEQLVFVLSLIHEPQADELRDGDTEDFYFMPEDTADYDFSSHIRELLILAVEIKPLCREDCLGICPGCGKNLNFEKCECNKEKIDERWLPLRDLKDRRL